MLLTLKLLHHLLPVFPIVYQNIIVTTLLGYGFKDIKEGTIYPLLVRLEKKGIITSEMRPSPLGPSRKYYSITPDGVEYLNEFKTNWKQISQSVNQIFDTEV